MIHICLHLVLHLQVTVVLEHMFHPSEMEEEATLREDLEDDIKTECTKMGPVEKVHYTFEQLVGLRSQFSNHITADQLHQNGTYQQVPCLLKSCSSLRELMLGWQCTTISQSFWQTAHFPCSWNPHVPPARHRP